MYIVGKGFNRRGYELAENRHPKMVHTGTSLAVQGLRLQASNAGGTGSIPGQGTKIPHAVRHGRGSGGERCILK